MQRNGVFTSRNVDFSSKDGDLSDLFYIYLHIIYIYIYVSLKWTYLHAQGLGIKIRTLLLKWLGFW